MLTLMVNFTRNLIAMPKHWVGWVGLLMAVNVAGSIYWFAALEAKAVLSAFVLAAMLQMFLFKRFGFVRLLGASHLPWLFLVPWLGIRVASGGLQSAFDYWMLSVVLVNGFSLAIDIVDVMRWFRGERAPTVVASDSQRMAARIRSG